MGRSPRARRSPRCAEEPRGALGSISASAEEPASRISVVAMWRVDLRERGGARAREHHTHPRTGRSPRARRSRGLGCVRRRACGSISASAEEPNSPGAGRSSTRVDLRERGGAASDGEPSGNVPGRSPRARRSQIQRIPTQHPTGSISASAEEPDACRGPRTPNRVDLRERGGAERVSKARRTSAGRSPRARRSRSRGRGASDRGGSISASAEEPPRLNTGAVSLGVDLRERGGAAVCPSSCFGPLGRSPRARRSRV